MFRNPVPRLAAICGAILISAMATVAISQDAKPAATTQPVIAKATLRDFEWFVGRWVGELEKGRTEEIWSGADAGVMMGVFRLISNEGKTSVIEVMTLREVDDTVELCFRHLNAEMVCWEPVDKPAVMRIKSITASEIVWIDPTAESPKKGVPMRQVWRHSGDKLDFEVYAMRDGVETKIIAGSETKKPLSQP